MHSTCTRTYQFTSHPVLSRRDTTRAADAGVLTALRAHGFLPAMAGGDDGDDGDADGSSAGDAGGDDEEGDGEAGDGEAGSADDDDDDHELVQAREEARRARAEAAEAKKRAAKAEREVKKRQQREREGANEFKTLYEESQRELGEMTGRFRQTRLREAVVQAAAAAKMIDPELAVDLVKLPLDDVVDDDFDVDRQAVERAMKDLRKKRKYLFRETDAQSTDVNGDRSGSRRRNGSGTDSNGGTSDDVTPGVGRMRKAYQDAAEASRSGR